MAKNEYQNLFSYNNWSIFQGGVTQFEINLNHAETTIQPFSHEKE